MQIHRAGLFGIRKTQAILLIVNLLGLHFTLQLGNLNLDGMGCCKVI
jgi:hypothetical protein